MKKTNKNTTMGVLMGMCLGISIGTSLGTVIGNTSIGVPWGLSIGMLIGLVIGAQKDSKVNEQLDEKGYIIQTIERNEENEEYLITIVNKLGEESIVNVPKGQMETEEFLVGDAVYLDDDGLLEQAFDKEDE